MLDIVPNVGGTVWTVGHSNHAIETFLDLLAQHQIAVVVDVRSSPYSRYADHFNREALPHPLAARSIRYLFLGDLIGGRAEGDEFYDEQGYVLYGKVAESPRFGDGIARLSDGITRYRVALMCGEEDPTECHRRLLIGRVLRSRGVEVVHIRGDGRLQTEDELAAEEEFQKTKGQLSLFEMEGPDEWKSTRSVLPRNPPPSSSEYSEGLPSTD